MSKLLKKWDNAKTLKAKADVVSEIYPDGDDITQVFALCNFWAELSKRDNNEIVQLKKALKRVQKDIDDDNAECLLAHSMGLWD